MSSNEAHKKMGKEKLQRVIEMCVAIENHAVDPFTLNVDEIIVLVKEYFPDWKQAEELNLDSEAIHHLASVIKLQSEWVKHRSTSLYTDPFLLEEKIIQTSKQQITSIFLKAWHPIIEKEQLSLRSIADGLLYWEALAPISQRWKHFDVPQVAMGTASRDELIAQRVLGDKEFSVELECYWQELKSKIEENGAEGKVKYWDFIGANTYEETVQRAFLTSFLVTYGYATLEIDKFEETIDVIVYDKQQIKLLSKQSTSVPILVSCENWKKWKRGETP